MILKDVIFQKETQEHIQVKQKAGSLGEKTEIMYVPVMKH